MLGRLCERFVKPFHVQFPLTKFILSPCPPPTALWNAKDRTIRTNIKGQGVSRSDISFLKNYLSFLSLLAVMYNTGRNKVLNSYGQSAAIMTLHFLVIVLKFCKG